MKWQRQLLKIDWTTEFSLEWTWLDCAASACESGAFFLCCSSELWLVRLTSLDEIDPCCLLISKVTVLFLLKNYMWTTLTLPCFDKWPLKFLIVSYMLSSAWHYLEKKKTNQTWGRWAKLFNPTLLNMSIPGLSVFKNSLWIKVFVAIPF